MHPVPTPILAFVKNLDHLIMQFKSFYWLSHHGIFIPLYQARVGSEIANEAHSAELAIIISYPTRASEIIVVLKTP